MRVWVTRSSPDAALSAERIGALGHDVVVAPVLQIRETPARPPTRRPDALVFTSPNGVRHHPRLPRTDGLRVYTVGDRTAEAACAAGYEDVRSARGDVDDLQALITAELAVPATLVHYHAERAAGDLKRGLEGAGHRVHGVIVYEARRILPTVVAGARGAMSSIEGIVVHSPRAAAVVAETISAAGWVGTVWCISEACTRRMRAVAGEATLRACRILWASHPSEAALLRLVAASASPPTPAGVLSSAEHGRIIAGGTATFHSVESGGRRRR